MKTDLRAVLLADGAVAAAFSTVSWAARPQGGSLPALVLHRIDRVDDYHLTGASNPIQTRVQADAWAATHAAAEAAADVVIACLSGFTGTQGTTDFQGVFLDAVRDQREAGGDDADRPYRVSMDFIVRHKEA